MTNYLSLTWGPLYRQLFLRYRCIPKGVNVGDIVSNKPDFGLKRPQFATTRSASVPEAERPIDLPVTVCWGRETGLGRFKRVTMILRLLLRL
jgi:hypothetical protein